MDELCMRLIRALVRGSAAEGESILRQPELDFERFVAVAQDERLAGFLYAAIHEARVASSFPPAAIARLRLSYLGHWAHNRLLLREAGRLADSLRSVAPDLVFLKGPLLAERLYGDVGVRACGDLDLLVRWSEVAGVERALLADGYARISSVPLVRRLAYVFTHHFSYRRGDVVVEVHWALQRHAGLRLDHDMVRARAVSIEVEGETLRAASTVDELVLQILSAFTDLQLGVARLRTFVDQYALLQALGANRDWRVFLFEREAQGLGRITLAMLALLFDLLDCADEFPTLSTVVATRRPKLAVLEPTRGLAALRTSALNVRQRVEWLQLCDVPLPLSLLWWALSLPARLLVHPHLPRARPTPVS